MSCCGTLATACCNCSFIAWGITQNDGKLAAFEVEACFDHPITDLFPFHTLYHDKLLQLSSDGPNVMKALQKKAIQDIDKDIVDIGTCNIHKTHNAFSAAFEAFDSSIETWFGGVSVFQILRC